MSNGPKKVLHVVLDLDLGGLQRVVQLLIERLDRTRFEPYICCLDRGGVLYEDLISRGVHGCVLHRLPGPFDFSLLLNLYRFVGKYKIDVIHSHNSCALYAGVAGQLAGVPVMVHTDHGRVLPDKRTARWESKMSSYLFDAYVGVSEELTNYLEERIGVARPKLKTIINGVDTARFLPRTKAERLFIRRQCGLNADDVVIGSVCRFDPIKNLSYLIARMPAILERIPKAKLLLVGEGSCQADLERQIRSFGLTDNVILMPRRNDVENVMPVMDLYANTSISEGTSMTILEAMACGVPVIASAVGGNNSLVSGSHGVLFPLENAALFVDNVVSLLRDISVLEDMGRAARNRAECSYGLSRMVEAYQSCYDAPQDPVSSAGDATRRGSQSDEPQRTLHNNIESATR